MRKLILLTAVVAAAMTRVGMAGESPPGIDDVMSEKERIFQLEPGVAATDTGQLPFDYGPVMTLTAPNRFDFDTAGLIVSFHGGGPPARTAFHDTPTISWRESAICTMRKPMTVVMIV